jgi:predicted RND superfamily exporter protein
MKFITSLINFLLVLLIGIPTPKNSLHKKPTKDDFYRAFNCWIQRNFYIIALASIIFLLICFVIFCFWIVGVSAVESGGMRNFINGGML